MACGWNTGIMIMSGPVGLSKLPSHEFRLKYLSNPYTIILTNKPLCVLIVPSEGAIIERCLINFHCSFVFMRYFFVDSAYLENLLPLKISRFTVF